WPKPGRAQKHERLGRWMPSHIDLQRPIVPHTVLVQTRLEPWVEFASSPYRDTAERVAEHAHANQINPPGKRRFGRRGHIEARDLVQGEAHVAGPDVQPLILPLALVAYVLQPIDA